MLRSEQAWQLDGGRGSQTSEMYLLASGITVLHRNIVKTLI